MLEVAWNYKLCVETIAVSPLLGRATVPHASPQEELGDAARTPQSNITWDGPWPLSLRLTAHPPKFQALFPGL